MVSNAFATVDARGVAAAAALPKDNAEYNKTVEPGSVSAVV